MRKGKVRPLIRKSSYLTTAEVAVCLGLLDKSDNGDCVIPVKFSPTVVELAEIAKVTTRTVRRALGHLALHGWIDYEPGQGRGHRGTYQVAPRTPDLACFCRELKEDIGASERGHESTGKEDIDVEVSAAQQPVSTGGPWRGKVGGSTSIEAVAVLPAVAVPDPRVPLDQLVPTIPVQPARLSTVTESTLARFDRAPATDGASVGRAIPWVWSLQDLRDQYPSTKSPKADALWCAGYDR